MSPPSTALRRAQPCRGFTLVEMMIAIMVALFLMAGVLRIVQDTRRATASQTQSTQLQDSVRLAMTTLTDVIQTAGYYSDVLYSTPPASLPASGSFAAGQSIVGTGAFAAAAPGDTISVRYQTANNDGILTCAGTSNLSGANQVYVNTFSVDATGNLLCQLGAAPAFILIPAITTGPNPVKITNLQILYGVQTNVLTANQSADSYMDAATVTGTTLANGLSAWTGVVSVRITLSFQNPLGAALPPLQFTRVIGLMSKMGYVT
ncbi:MAG TPA: prepilin-type N-terminal cleavage/methylation domain-containing protein [Steroidobacteraceae bacterium]|jgi:type IV pilus assembly protein PilW